MKKVLAGIIAFMFILFPVRIYAASWNEITELLDDSLQLVKQEEYDKATQLLTYFSKQFLTIDQKKKIAPEHIRVISLAYDKALQSLERQGINKQIKIDDVLALRLVMDAEVSKYQPLWVEREENVMSTFGKIENAMQKEEHDHFQEALNVFLHEFDIIYPSLMVDLSEEELQRVNSHLSYLDEFRYMMIQNKNGQTQVKIIKDDLTKIFRTAKKDEVDSSLIWFMTVTGGIIIFTLTYVGWRKYKGEKEKQKSTLHSKNR
ncbi:sporulation protein YpjB [Bacillus sp. 491mf]|uniref:sporulation protein YpjB n=1 Tax=Bacillus TaxID=1386 RepID=UPI0005581A77|nr:MULTISPECIES: sporulation protein YpjB [unclassified Bacillus (in: firmicutes)]SFC17698.1 sporulation protein YpjB [Bacillus sp. 491mf]